MAKKKKTYTLNEVKERAFSYLQTTKFGGVYPSDKNSNWNWGIITDITGNKENGYGIYVRFALQIFSVSFAELDMYPVFDDGDKVLCYKHYEDLSEKEKHNLRICGFLERL
jgi:hypothetical protein